MSHLPGVCRKRLARFDIESDASHPDRTSAGALLSEAPSQAGVRGDAAEGRDQAQRGHHAGDRIGARPERAGCTRPKEFAT
jgi:hypothetical protein